MMLPISLLRAIVLLAGLSAVSLCAQVQDAAPMVHANRSFTIPTDLVGSTNALVENAKGPVIIVRYLGYNCSHCVRQLLYLNEHAHKLRQLGVHIIAVSNDPLQRWQQLRERYDVNAELFTYAPDTSASLARALGAQRVINDTVFDLHATIVRHGDVIRYVTFGTEPDMDVERIVGAVANGAQQAPVAVEPEYIDRYLQRQPTTTVIAGPSDGVVEPLDLDFNRSYLHPNDLWVVTSGKRGHGMTIIHEATSSNPVIVNKRDSRASHFMWRTMALSMGTNGAFATAQNGEPGDGDGEYMFMGPTLWSSDTSVFASRYQDDDKYLASHLDMLHQSPFDLGIAHDSANVYWVSDAKYKGISRYDFRDPHEVGGTDHRDGIIRRYVETSIVPAERGRPAHIALDKSTGYLYYVDPGRGAIHCLDTRTGRVKDTLPMPPSSAENVEEFTSVVDSYSWTVVTGLPRPIGIEVIGKRLLVGDEQTARIHVYAIDGKNVTSMGYIQTTATSLHGITVGPDGRIWFVDKKAATVCRLDLGPENTFTANQRVIVRKAADTVSFAYTNTTASTYQPVFATRMWNAATGVWGSWSDLVFGPKIPGSSSVNIIVDAAAPDTTSWYILEVAEVDSKGSPGLRAQTTIVPERTRKVVVQDERNGTFDIYDAVLQTARNGYTTLPSDVFVQVAHELPYLKTMLWNCGTSGELSIVDDAVLRACIEKNIDVMLVGDDPLILRTDLPQSIQFFREFGVSIRGAQQVSSDDGSRTYEGVLADPVSAAMGRVECQLPRLTHHRGGQYIPSVVFRPTANGFPVLRVTADTMLVAARYQNSSYRSIILGINASRFLDGGQRTLLLDKGLLWLEGAADPDKVDTVSTSVPEMADAHTTGINLYVRVNGRLLEWNATQHSSQYMTIELYASTGQKIADCYSGRAQEQSGTTDLQNVSAGCYHVIARTEVAVIHRAIIVR